MGDGGAMGGRTAGRPRQEGDGVSPSGHEGRRKLWSEVVAKNTAAAGELKKTSFAFFSVRPLEKKRRLSSFRKLTGQILGVTF